MGFVSEDLVALNSRHCLVINAPTVCILLSRNSNVCVRGFSRRAKATSRAVGAWRGRTRIDVPRPFFNTTFSVAPHQWRAGPGHLLLRLCYCASAKMRMRCAYLPACRLSSSEKLPAVCAPSKKSPLALRIPLCPHFVLKTQEIWGRQFQALQQ